MNRNILITLLLLIVMTGFAKETPRRIGIVTLDPGHFHAALVQKTMLVNADSTVHVYAPAGNDLQLHLARIAAYNTRTQEPTRWNEVLHTGDDYFERMLAEKKGNLVVLSGNNRKKTEYILRSLDAGFNVLADKPMIIDNSEFDALKRAFAVAEKRHLLLLDIMTERYEVTTRLQRELSRMPDVFGTLELGTAQDPAVVMKSVHNVSKTVSGGVLTRPAWFFDVAQQGEGIADVMTHLVDLVQWECFPEQAIDYAKEITVTGARHWTIGMTIGQFSAVTKLPAVPEYLRNTIGTDSLMHLFFNGEINYTIRGVHAQTTALWEFAAPVGAGDTHYSMLRGTKSRLVIRQGAGEKFITTLSIEPVAGSSVDERQLAARIDELQKTYPGIGVKRSTNGWEVVVPAALQEGHEEHFARVMTTVGEFYRHTPLPSWEVPNMLAKYYTTARALELAKRQ
jgi:predicted dehydrogenase